jgi:hypothetical protein
VSFFGAVLLAMLGSAAASAAPLNRAHARTESVSFDIERVPGLWTKEGQGFRTKDGLWQLFVSRTDLGAKADAKPDPARAVLVLESMIKSPRQAQLQTRSARANEAHVQAAAKHLCVVGRSDHPPERSLSFVFFRPGNHWQLTLEVLLAGPSDETLFVQNAAIISQGVLRQLREDWSADHHPAPP